MVYVSQVLFRLTYFHCENNKSYINFASYFVHDFDLPQILTWQTINLRKPCTDVSPAHVETTISLVNHLCLFVHICTYLYLYLYEVMSLG